MRSIAPMIPSLSSASGASCSKQLSSYSVTAHLFSAKAVPSIFSGEASISHSPFSPDDAHLSVQEQIGSHEKPTRTKPLVVGSGLVMIVSPHQHSIPTRLQLHLDL